MKEIFLILLGFLLVFPSCETDFDVHAPWEEIAVVYGLLDQRQDRQYIKINKAYLGSGDALQMAQISDSINFLPENMVVRLYKLQGQDTIDVVNLDTTTSIVKDDGLFASGISDNIIYTFDQQQDSFALETDHTYVIAVKNKSTGNFVSANTLLIDGSLPAYSFFREDPNLEQPFEFYIPPTSEESEIFKSENIKWLRVDFGAIYQLDVRFNYKENNVEKFLIWRQPLLTPGSSSSMSTKLWGDSFFNFLSNNLEKNSSFTREFMSLDIIMTIGTSELVKYISMHEPYEGLVQERPVYTNINNGFGLFSSRLTYELTDISLGTITQDYLKSTDGLDRNFQ